MMTMMVTTTMTTIRINGSGSHTDVYASRRFWTSLRLCVAAAGLRVRMAAVSGTGLLLFILLAFVL